MPRILVVAGNPDHQRSLGGLIRHRTSSTLDAVESCSAGVQAAARDRPDVILVNVLLYLEGDFDLRRALAGHEATRGIPILVHYSGTIEDLTRRRIEESGAAGLLELPVSAEELVGVIGRAVNGLRAAASSGAQVRAVQWPQVTARKGEAETAADDDRAVKPVDWGSVALSARPEQAATRSRAPDTRPVSEPSPRRPQAAPTGDEATGFRSSSFRSADPSKVKGGGKGRFEEKAWPAVDPNKVRKTGRRGR